LDAKKRFSKEHILGILGEAEARNGSEKPTPQAEAFPGCEATGNQGRTIEPKH
jgi:hypothetical protein